MSKISHSLVQFGSIEEFATFLENKADNVRLDSWAFGGRCIVAVLEKYIPE